MYFSTPGTAFGPVSAIDPKDAAPYLNSDQKARIREWTGEGIVRVSVGLESPQDLIADLDQALHAHTLKGRLGPRLYALMKSRSK